MRVFAAVWMIIIGGWLIIFFNGRPIVVCIACTSQIAVWILGVVSIVLGLATLATGRRAG